MMSLRAIPNEENKRIAGGIVIPFRVRDKYKTWWDEKSDIAKDLFLDKPVFWLHLLKGKLVRAGTVIQESLRMTDEGWYAEAIIDDDFMWNEISSGRAAWSTGSLSHLVKVRSDGYVEVWPFVELSAAPKDQVGSLPNTTTAHAIRAIDLDTFYEEQLLGENVMPKDGITIPTVPIVPVTPVAPVAPVQDDPQATGMQQVLDALGILQTQATEQAGKGGPAV